MEVSQYRGQDLGRGNDMQRHATSQKWLEIKHIQGYIEALSLCVGYRHHEREGTTVNVGEPATPDTPTTADAGQRQAARAVVTACREFFSLLARFVHVIALLRCASGAQGCSRGWRPRRVACQGETKLVAFRQMSLCGSLVKPTHVTDTCTSGPSMYEVGTILV
jgi:hypothetical protein